MAQKKAQKPVGRNEKGIKGQERQSKAKVVSGACPKSGEKRRQKATVAAKSVKKSKKKPPDTSPDGGLNALLGFVNQMLGSAADFAVCISPKVDDNGGFKTLISFETERQGQDSCATGLSAGGHKERVLKQYKYSSNPGKYKIGTGELKEIVATLRKSEKKANKDENLATDLVLCTNRPLTQPAQKSPEYSMIRHELYDVGNATDVLESCALRFGVFNPDELSAAVQRATHHLFNIAISSSHSLSKAGFEEALIGHKKPQSIVLPEAAPQRFNELIQLGAQTLRLVSGSLAERENLRAAAIDFLNDAIVAFVGDGGCGKTTAIWQLLCQALNAKPPQAFAHMMIFHGQPFESIGAVIEGWRGVVSPATPVSDRFAIERLVRANPNAPSPIVLLGLDGIDEGPVSGIWAETAARVLDFFWKLHVDAKTSGEDPVARLFVSCRSQSDIENLLPNPTGAGIGEVAPRYVRFGEFTSGELQHLAWNAPGLDNRASQRIAQYLIGESEAPDIESGLPSLSISTLLAPSALDLLRHPILWRSFASLNAEDQNAVLDGSVPGQDKLGAAFLDWFCDRAKRRIQVEAKYLPIALRGVASGCPEPASTYRLETWVQRMRSAAGFTEQVATNVYHECVSSGLVQDISPAGGPESHRSWRWKHVFLAEYLKGPAGA
jgi:hypothetical protein